MNLSNTMTPSESASPREFRAATCLLTFEPGEKLNDAIGYGVTVANQVRPLHLRVIFSFNDIALHIPPGSNGIEIYREFERLHKARRDAEAEMSWRVVGNVQLAA